MLAARRLAMVFPALGLAVGLLLASMPQHHTYPPGTGKAGFFEGQTVSCGTTFAPKNPRGSGYDDNCDAEHTRRGAYILMTLMGGLLLGGILVVLSRRMPPAPPFSEPRPAS